MQGLHLMTPWPRKRRRRRARVSEAPVSREPVSPEGLHLARSSFCPRMPRPQEVGAPADSPIRVTAVLCVPSSGQPEPVEVTIPT